MARTLIPASNPGLLLTANQDHVLGQAPILKPIQLRMDDDTQAALLEQALALLSATEKRLADQRERIAYLETMAMTDILTSLPNRREFEHTLLRTLATARRYVESGALAFIDLDNFKTVNDTLGHEAGDCVLVHVAELLSGNVRAADMVARLGGDEFVVLMVRTAPEEAIKRARELQSMVNRAGSTGRRNTFSLTGLQALVQSFGGSSPSEGLAGPCIERVSNNCEYVRTVCAQIGSFREVLSKQSIGVLVRSALPRAVRFAEVDGKAGCDPQIRMPGHLCSLVPGQRAAKLRWQCRDRPGDGIANRFSPMTGKRRPVLHARDGAVAFHSGKMQQHCEPRGAFHQSADRRSAQADDQVTFPVSGYGPISCFRRSFTDHDLRRDEGFAPPAATCPRHAQCPSRAKAGGQLTTECAAALYVERLIDRLMTDPHRLIFGPVPRIVDPKTVRDLLRTPGPGPSPVLPRPMPTTVPDDAWPLDHRSIRCRDPTRKPILHIAPQRLIRCQLGWLRPFGGSISMPLRRRCSVVQATASGRRVAPHLAGDRRRCSLQPASNMTYASSLGAQKSNLLTFLERQVTS